MKRMFRITKSFFNHSFLKVVVAGLFLMFFIYFVRNEHIDIRHINSILGKANPFWVGAGLIITIAYLFLQATLYVFSFKSITINIDFSSALSLFLKRNFISTFLPAGSFTSLAFFGDELKKHNLQQVQVHYGSFLFALASMISVVLISIPAIASLFFHRQLRPIEFYGLLFLISLIALSIYIGYGLVKRSGIAYKIVCRISPLLITQLAELSNMGFRPKEFLKACLISLAIEIAGVAHLYISLAALGLHPSWEVSLIGYAIMIIILSVSPFFRGLGAIEVSVAYVLTLYGYPILLAASVTFLFRLFEFWLPFIISASKFVVNRGNLLLRIFPSIFLMLLGMVNIVSALTPAIPARLRLLHDFIPVFVTEFSNLAVLLMGVIMIISSAFLLTGAKNAWKIALGISSISLLLHLTKAFDYEEAGVALITIGILWYTRSAYFVKYNVTFHLKSAQKILTLIIALFTYSIAGFYLLQVRHLDFDFSWTESLRAAIKTTAFLTEDLNPQTTTGHYFIYSVQFGSVLIVGYSLLILFRLSRGDRPVTNNDFQIAREILDKYGHSSLDYFKVYPDKQLYFNESQDAFLSFSESRHYSVVLENPVAADKTIATRLLTSFEDYCSERGLRTFYYRVPEEDLPMYLSLKKKNILLGQEAIVDIVTFSLEGSSRKSMRNAVNKIEKAGFQFKVYHAPLKDGLIQQLKAVSHEWLGLEDHAEAGFSQGVFHSKEIKKCMALTVENEESKIVAFLNIIPSYKPGEATYDLIRHSHDSPNGVLDYLIIKMIQFLKTCNFKTLNMGMAPLAGMKGVTLNEQIMQFYKENFKQASRLTGLFEYKNKFEPRWENRYLIYDQTFDLIRFPMVLRMVSDVSDLPGL
ncbi:MAG TPA: phosphatidylglycerol lysyltransferase domain-containing protein [Cyclobacteriaceae bacterium]|nr:phosphatidylglycerol lysyltransferase domain-containing protein [Cyclobacteriaceae bacterium]